jgi:predicted acylesterase/phospholipase RssA
MAEPIQLEDVDLNVDRERIGISYSGGGPLVLIELGCARAFVDKGIIPYAIAGVSAGSLAGTAHALDPVKGTGIDLAVELLGQITQSTLQFGVVPVLERLVSEREHIKSVADHARIAPMIRDGIQKAFGHVYTMGTFPGAGGPKLMIAATNRLDGTSYWFPDEAPVDQAILASAAIPGVFPWQEMTFSDGRHVLVDGGVITNQPISRLVLEGCGTLFVCAVGYAGGLSPEPTNAWSNFMPCIDMTIHQASKLEEAYVRCRLGDQGVVHHIHPDVKTSLGTYNFPPDLIKQVVEESRQLTVDWLANELHY